MPKGACRWIFAGVAAVLAASSGDVQAAGYALKEQSATAQGNAFAGATAGAEDPSYIFFNPAALGRLDGTQAQVVLSHVGPRAELRNVQGFTLDGTPISGARSQHDAARDETVAAFYGTTRLDHGLHLGLAVNTPFGLETRYDGGWAGRYTGVRTRLATLDVNPMVAWSPSDRLTLAGGFIGQYASGDLTNAIDFGTIGRANGIPGAVPGAQDGFARLSGDDLAYGFNLGALLEPVPGTRVGIAYRSKIKHQLRGRVDFRGDDAGIASTLRATGLFQDTRASLGLTTPAILSFGAHQDLGHGVAVMAEADLTNWSSLDQLETKFGNPRQPSSVSRAAWTDSWFVALGATWQPVESLSLRVGAAYDQSPIDDDLRSTRIPDEDRYWLSFGVGWQVLSWLGVDAAYSHIFMPNARVDSTAAGAGDPTRGSLHADYEEAVDIVSLAAKARF